MNITKIMIKNLFGISEYEADGKSVELGGENGAGKTSVIDAIRYALTNKSDRDYIVKNGATEGEILIETDSGLRIDRKKRNNMADYKSVKRNGTEVASPESFLKDIFTELQLSPVEFMNMDKKQQNRILLDLIEFDWDLQWIREKFGELPPDIDYGQNILTVLNDIQAENGPYYMNRREIDRNIRNKQAFVEDIGQTLPSGYTSDKWENADLGAKYRAIETIRKENETIEKAKALVENKNNKVRKFEADREISIAALDREVNARSNQIANDILKLNEQIKALGVEKDTLSDKKSDKLEIIEQKYKADIATYEAECREYEEYAVREPKDITELQEEATTIENMKSYVNEYKRMTVLQNEIAELQADSVTLTEKIERARNLPGEILQTATIPITNLTIKDGVPLIKGLPVSNLSDGEKLDLCIDIAIQNPKGLQIILIDGVEKLSTKLKNQLYAKCKAKGLQFISTRTDDSEELTVIEL